MTAEDLLRSPLAGRATALARIGQVSRGHVSATEVAGLAQVSLRAGASVAARMPFVIPTEPNTVAGDRDRDALWLGPDEWLVVGIPGTAARIHAELAAALAGTHHSVVDVSAGRAVVELLGPGRHEVLSSGCSIDLHPPTWGPGRCAQTLFGRAQVLLHERPETTRMFVRPSFGDYLVDRLLDAASAP